MAYQEAARWLVAQQRTDNQTRVSQSKASTTHLRELRAGGICIRCVDGQVQNWLADDLNDEDNPGGESEGSLEEYYYVDGCHLNIVSNCTTREKRNHSSCHQSLISVQILSQPSGPAILRFRSTAPEGA